MDLANAGEVGKAPVANQVADVVSAKSSNTQENELGSKLGTGSKSNRDMVFQRSPAIVIAFLMKCKGWRLAQGYQWVKERRPSVELTESAVFQNCDLTPCKPGRSQRNMVTAQSRTDVNQNTGIVIQKCRIKATSDLEPVIKEFPSFLGRPWEEYARVVVMQTTMSNVIDKEGWSTWNGQRKSPYYAEYDNNGAGADTSGRVPWSLVINEAQAKTFTAGPFIGGTDWLSSTGFPYQLGLYK